MPRFRSRSRSRAPRKSAIKPIDKKRSSSKNQTKITASKSIISSTANITGKIT